MKKGEVLIVTAPWVLSFDKPLIKNGAVALLDGRIVGVGSEHKVAERFSTSVTHRYPGVLLPALVNAHMHLELSCFNADTALDANSSFTDWVEDLLQKRAHNAVSEKDIRIAAERQIEKQFESGVVFIGDIGNIPEFFFSPPAESHLPQVYHMLEFLGSTHDAVQNSFKRLENLPVTVAAVAHAPYSTRPELLVKIKERCDRLGHIFSVHTSETWDELSFITSQTGLFRDFLEKRGTWDGEFFRNAPESSSTIDYFSRLGLLNAKTLLVHCVSVSDQDLAVVQESGAKICVCPGSNAFLHSGVAPVKTMLDYDIIPALGTDSPASNPQPDMWAEMQRVAADHPGIDAVMILKMATQAGAKAFGLDAHYGNISLGKAASFLHVDSKKINNCKTDKELLNVLVKSGKPEIIQWIQQPLMHSQSK
ncbi:amidohydrolase family protein [Desulforhopalus sp. IMCC35007]|uniref:amidohydrolase family protein n=1 Tax=Desulforhopalus sp. IMCC35007 TaxID=2569543 RepID=UPI00145D194A|nr:amidohydrolase family protein [Desulforhopalus sp. IMCC35007]